MKRTYTIILFVFLVTSCAPIYVPNTRNTPLLAKAGEFQGALQYGTSGVDLQGAVAITNHFALMGNFSYGNRNTDTLNQDVTDNYHKHKFYEGAIGYYNNQNLFSFEVFLGYGKGDGTSFGNYSIFSSSQDELVTGKFTRIFLQPSFGINKKFVTIAFTPRFSLVDFSEFYRPSTSSLKLDLSPKLFIEPAVTTRFNFLDNRIFATLQFGVSSSLTENVPFDYDHFNFSTGLGVRLGGIHWNEDPK